MGYFGSPLHGDATGTCPSLQTASPSVHPSSGAAAPSTRPQGHRSVWKGIWTPGLGPTPPEGLCDPVSCRSAGTGALDFTLRETKSFCRRHSRPWGDKGSSRLSFCHLPCSDKAQHLLVLGGQDKFRCGGFRTSGDLFAAVALRRERAAWPVRPLRSWY